PATQQVIEQPHLFRLVPPLRSTRRGRADLVTDRLDLLRGRRRGYLRLARAPRIPAPERESQKGERLVRHRTRPLLAFVHRQLQLCHHVPHHGRRLRSLTPRQDHEVIRIIDDVGLQALFVPQYLPAQQESPHVQIRQQRRGHPALRRASSFVLVAGRP